MGDDPLAGNWFLPDIERLSEKLKTVKQNINPSTFITLRITEKCEDQAILYQSTWFTETSSENPIEKRGSIAMIRGTDLILILIKMILVHQYYLNVIGNVLNPLSASVAFII